MLDDRKVKVLYAIINSYLLSAEPIGSRTITKEYDLGVSSATIRNEMSDLEDLGYLNKPHSSAGRVPSDKAYRMYVNQLLSNKEYNIDIKKKNELKKLLIRESREIEQLLQNSSRILSALTSYTAIAISPQLKNSTIKHVQLTKIDELEILMVLVSSTGLVKNSIFRLEETMPRHQITILSNILNEKLKGLSFNEIDEKVIDDIIRELYEFRSVINNIIPVISRSMEDIDDVELYSDGVNKILNFPEYNDLEKAKSFMKFLEDKDLIVELLLNNTISQDIEIIIGEENVYAPMKDCSLLTTTYKLDGKTVGKIGVIGPTRMDYFRVISTLQLFSENINEIINILMI